MSPVRIAIIGAGVSGSACAHALAAAGHRVTVFEKSRGSGGRLASKRSGEWTMNLGAQSLRARSPQFREQLAVWEDAGLLQLRGSDWWPTANTSQLARSLLHGVEFVTSTRIATIEIDARAVFLVDENQQRYGPFVAAVSSAPPAQAAVLVQSDPILRGHCESVEMLPAWVAVFDAQRAWSPQPLPASVARVVDRVGGAAYFWTVEASAEWSSHAIERDPLWVGAQLREALAAPDIELRHCHRWRFARVATPLGQPCVWRPPLGICGDWLCGDDVEAAWHSGRALAEALLASNPI